IERHAWHAEAAERHHGAVGNVAHGVGEIFDVFAGRGHGLFLAAWAVAMNRQGVPGVKAAEGFGGTHGSLHVMAGLLSPGTRPGDHRPSSLPLPHQLSNAAPPPAARLISTSVRAVAGSSSAGAPRGWAGWPGRRRPPAPSPHPPPPSPRRSPPREPRDQRPAGAP